MAKKTEAKSKKQPAKDKRVRAVIEELPVPLTQAEIVERAKALAQCEVEIRDEEQHAETVKKGLKQREGLLLVKRSQLADIVRSGREPRPIRVEGWIRYSEGIYEEIRTDTGEVQPGSRRRLSDDERQVSLPLIDDEKPEVTLSENLGDRLEKPSTETEAKAVEEDTKAAKKTSKRRAPVEEVQPEE